jgi:hypothetical protein
VSFTAPERETVIVLNDADELATVYSAQRPVINRLKKNPAARLVNEGRYGRSRWAEFELPKRFVSFRSKRRVFSAEERARRGAALRDSRATAATHDSADSDRQLSAEKREEAA